MTGIEQKVAVSSLGSEENHNGNGTSLNKRFNEQNNGCARAL